MNLLTVTGLSVRYGALEALENVGFTLDEGRWLMVLGPNGAGKSTLVEAITQGVASTGDIRFKGEDVRRMRPDALARRIGVLSQSHAVGYAFSVEEVVRLGRYARAPGLFAKEGDDGAARVRDALERTGLTELRGKSVLALSGGELQRVFLAQVFAQDPELLILDEPTNHLDMVYQKQVFELLGAWLRAPGRAVISVVHDLSLALAYGTDALLLNRGKAAAFGPVRAALAPENLERVYGMDVRAWMRGLLRQWE